MEEEEGCSSGVRKRERGYEGAKKGRAAGGRRFAFSNLIRAGSGAGQDKKEKGVLSEPSYRKRTIIAEPGIRYARQKSQPITARVR